MRYWNGQIYTIGMAGFNPDYEWASTVLARYLSDAIFDIGTRGCWVDLQEAPALLPRNEDHIVRGEN